MVTIQKNYPCFKDFKFLLKASNKNSIKPVFSKMFLDDMDEKIVCVCTDTQRMHVVVDTFDIFKDCEKGLYDIIKNDAKEIVFNMSDSNDIFPQYQNILVGYLLLVNTFQVEYTDTIVSKILSKFYEKFPYSSLCFNENFVHDALIKDQELTFSIKNHPNNRPYLEPFMFTYANGDIKALIMPVKTQI
jgi:hypothetical protein